MRYSSFFPLVLFVAGIVLTGGCATSTSETPLAERGRGPSETVVSQFKQPESVAHDAVADVYLVTNVAGSPFEPDGNGFISRVRSDGSVVEEQWIGGLDAPKGLALAGDTLYVADLTTLRRFDRRTGRALESMKVPGAGFLNDVAIGSDGTVFVSDSGIKPAPGGFAPSGTAAIYRVRPGERAEKIAAGVTLGLPNGLAALPTGDLLVATLDASGRLLRVRPDGSISEEARLPAGMLDGLVVLSGGELLVSSWTGSALYAVTAGEAARKVISGLESPADFAVDAGRGRLVLPLFLSSSVRFVNLPADLAGDDSAATVQERPSSQIGSLRTALSVERLHIPAGLDFLNGIARRSDGALLVGTMRSGRIAQIESEKPSTWFVAESGEEVFAGAALRYDASRGLLWGTSTDVFPAKDSDGTPVRQRARLFARDGHTGRLVRSIEVPEGAFANDLALSPDGAVYITDSFGPSILRFRPNADVPFERYVESPLLDASGEGLGPAGIARAPDGTLVIGLYGPGHLVRVRPPQGERGAPAVDRIALPRRLENPDGIALLRPRAGAASQLLADEATVESTVLLVLEGAADSGDGRLLRITLNGPLSGPRPLSGRIDTLAIGMTGPVNLTTASDGVSPDTVWVTESGVQFRFEGGFNIGSSAVYRFLLP